MHARAAPRLLSPMIFRRGNVKHRASVIKTCPLSHSHPLPTFQIYFDNVTCTKKVDIYPSGEMQCNGHISYSGARVMVVVHQLTPLFSNSKNMNTNTIKAVAPLINAGRLGGRGWARIPCKVEFQKSMGRCCVFQRAT